VARAKLGIVAALGAALAAPAAAEAHGLVQRANLPIPEWLFLWAAAIVLIVSFAALGALWPSPRLEETGWRPLPGGAFVGSRAVEVMCATIGVALLGIVIWAGFAGRQGPLDNFAPPFVLIIFWVGAAFASALFGDVFRAFNPWRAIGRVLAPLLPAPRAYPERVGRWPAALGLLAFTWIELVAGWGEQPRSLVIAACVYVVAMLAGQARYGVDTWERRADGFAVYFNLFARLSVWETRGRVLGLRPPLGGLPKLDPVSGTVAVVVVMIGTVTFDGLSAGPLWRDVGGALDDLWTSLGLSFETAGRLTGTAGLLGCVALVGLFYRLGIAGARSVGGTLGEPALRRALVHSLVPIAFVYVAAHYLTFLLFEGQSIGYLASDPLGHGWNLFGTAASGIDYSILGQEATWYLQVAFVVCGHVAGLVLAHDRALALYDEARHAVRSQYWMLGVMVGFTTLALWLLAEAGRT
jgi:hypothetical protein